MDGILQLVRRYPMLYLRWRILNTGDAVWVERKLLTTAVCIGNAAEGVARDHWCYATEDAAIAAYKAWEPFECAEPSGWVRNPRTGRRRPKGDASKEEIRQ